MKENEVIENLPVIGILGDGQLAMMMAQAYQKLGGKAFVLATSQEAPAAQYADKVVLGDFNNSDDVLTFSKMVDVVTLENEFVNSDLLIDLVDNHGVKIFPDPHGYRMIEDKLSENLFFKDLGIPLAEFFEVKEESDLLDKPGFLKLSKGGYDGIGTYKVSNKQEAAEIFNTIKSSGVVLFEHQVNFVKELSLVVAASKDDMVFYPMVETHQQSCTCRYVSYPSGISETVENEAREYIGRVMKALNTSGVFAFELFLTEDNQLIINESAPRPHNSGHITMDLADCSQFENHMRAVAGLELKQPTLQKDEMLMVNLLGTRNGKFEEQEVLANLNDECSNVKFYGKHESRVKRKMGHINMWGHDLWQRAEKLVDTLEI